MAEMKTPTNPSTLEIVGGTIEALRELGCDVQHLGIVSCWPGGHRIIVRKRGPGHPVYSLFVSGSNVTICFTSGSTITTFDLADPDSLEKIAASIKDPYPRIGFARSALPMKTRAEIGLTHAEHAQIIDLWGPL